MVDWTSLTWKSFISSVRWCWDNGLILIVQTYQWNRLFPFLNGSKLTDWCQSINCESFFKISMECFISIGSSRTVSWFQRLRVQIKSPSSALDNRLSPYATNAEMPEFEPTWPRQWTQLTQTHDDERRKSINRKNFSLNFSLTIKNQYSKFPSVARLNRLLINSQKAFCSRYFSSRPRCEQI